MPIIAGGIWRKNIKQGFALQDTLEGGECGHISTHSIKGEGTNVAYYLTAGKRSGESLAERVEVLPHNQGILVGRLFERSTGKPARLTAIDWHQVCTTKGASLSKEYWGRYVLAIYDNTKQSIVLLRDPQGLATVFYTITIDGILFATELAHIFDALPSKPSIDWGYVSTYIAHDGAPSCNTPLRGITELLPGCAVTLHPDNEPTQKRFWDPAHFCQDSSLSEEELESQIVEKFKLSMSAWTSGTEGACVELSGGIDSSAVLMMLREVMPDKRIIAVNFGHPAIASSDESSIAREVADFCGAEFVHIDWSKHLSPVKKGESSVRLNKPTPASFDASLIQAMGAIAHEAGDFDYISGHGGDHLFLEPPSIKAVADYWLCVGSRGLFSKIKEMSAQYRMPLWAVARRSLQYIGQYYRGAMSDERATIDPWMNDKLKGTILDTMYTPDYTDALKKLPPGKAEHVLAMHKAIVSVDPGLYARGKPTIHPFLSQPLIECVLSVPVFKLFGNGYTRLPFRRAMNRFRKNKFVWRRRKGDTTGVFIVSFRKNLSRIQELCLDGLMVKEGLVDRDKLERHINDVRHGAVQNMWPFMHFLACELWFESWGL